jgi:polar amino acid transport system substrate-binding protein
MWPKLIHSLWTGCQHSLRALLCASGLWVCLHADAAAQEIRIVTEEAPPFNMTVNGRITGLSTDVVRAVLEEAGLRAPIQSMPWARAYDIALNAENVLIYSITRTPQREKLFKWVGTVAATNWYLYARANSSVSLSNIDDARKHQISTVSEDAGEQYLLNKGFVIGKNLQSSGKYDVGYKKLKLGRVDLFISDELSAHYMVRQAGDDPAQVLVRALALPDLSQDGGIGMAFSLKTPDALVERFRTALEKRKKNGTYERLQKKWL